MTSTGTNLVSSQGSGTVKFNGTAATVTSESAAWSEDSGSERTDRREMWWCLPAE